MLVALTVRLVRQEILELTVLAITVVLVMMLVHRILPVVVAEPVQLGAILAPPTPDRAVLVRR